MLHAINSPFDHRREVPVFVLIKEMAEEKKKLRGAKLSHLDEKTVREAVAALLAFHKKKQDKEIFLNEFSEIKLIISLWRIVGKKAKTYQIKVPHSLRTPETEVCLITKDDKTDPEETTRHYQELLDSKGVTEVNEVMPLQVLKKEYKAFESRRKLSKRYDIFLADDRVYRLMHVHLGKEFYRRKKYPVTVDLSKGDLKKEILKAIDATYFILTNRGNTNHLTAAHTGMTLDQAVENIMAAVQGVTSVMEHGWNNIKALYVRTDESVSLPLHTSLVFKGWEKNPKFDHRDIWRLKKQLEVTGDTSPRVKPLPTPEEEAQAKRFTKRSEKRAATAAATKEPAEKKSPGADEGSPKQAGKRKAAAVSEDPKEVGLTTPPPAKRIIKEKQKAATSLKKARPSKKGTPGKLPVKSQSAKKAKAK